MHKYTLPAPIRTQHILVVFLAFPDWTGSAYGRKSCLKTIFWCYIDPVQSGNAKKLRVDSMMILEHDTSKDTINRCSF
jgi:hypothetical protein